MKKAIAILVLGLFLSGNAYALKLSKCYRSEVSNPNDDYMTTPTQESFESNFYLNYEFTINPELGVVTNYISYTDEGFQILREHRKDADQADTNDYQILVLNENIVKAEHRKKYEFGSDMVTTYHIDLKRGTVLARYSGTTVDWTKWQCEMEGSIDGGSSAASSGSGFFINKQGYFVTNYHVVKGCNDKSKIKFKENDVDAKLIAKDETLDLALLKAEVKPEAFINISEDNPKKRQKIIVAGYPFGEGLSDDLKMNEGAISSLKGFEDNSNQIQIDAAINPGNSGGPIVNEDGDLMGVAVSGLSKEVSEGIGFGIKASSVKNFLEVNNAKYSTPSLFSFGMNDEKLNKLLEESTIYTFCN